MKKFLALLALSTLVISPGLFAAFDHETGDDNQYDLYDRELDNADFSPEDYPRERSYIDQSDEPYDPRYPANENIPNQAGYLRGYQPDKRKLNKQQAYSTPNANQNNSNSPYYYQNSNAAQSAQGNNQPNANPQRKAIAYDLYDRQQNNADFGDYSNSRSYIDETDSPYNPNYPANDNIPNQTGYPDNHKANNQQAYNNPNIYQQNNAQNNQWNSYTQQNSSTPYYQHSTLPQNNSSADQPAAIPPKKPVADRGDREYNLYDRNRMGLDWNNNDYPRQPRSNNYYYYPQ